MYRAKPLIGLAFLLTLVAAVPPPAAAQEAAAERLYAQARRLLQGGEAEAALEELRLLVQQFPEDRLAPKALLRVAEIRRAQGDFENTRRTLEKLSSEYGRSIETSLTSLKPSSSRAKSTSPSPISKSLLINALEAPLASSP